MKSYKKIYHTEHFRMCADQLVSSGLCESHKEFWKDWVGLEGPIPQQHTLYVCLTMRNISTLKGSIGAQALIIDDCIDYAASKASSDQLYREFETLDVAHRLIGLAVQSEFSRN